MQGSHKLWQVTKLRRVDGEVESAVHDVDVPPLGVEGDAGLPGAAPGSLHISQAGEAGSGRRAFSPVVAPATEVEPQGPVGRYVVPSHCCGVLTYYLRFGRIELANLSLDDLFWAWAQEEVDIYLSPDGAVD